VRARLFSTAAALPEAGRDPIAGPAIALDATFHPVFANGLGASAQDSRIEPAFFNFMKQFMHALPRAEREQGIRFTAEDRPIAAAGQSPSLLCVNRACAEQQEGKSRKALEIGLSSGETNSLFALGAWKGMHELLHEVEECGLYTTVLGGRAEAIREDWMERGIEGDCWSSYWVSAPLQEVQAAVEKEAGRAHYDHQRSGRRSDRRRVTSLPQGRRKDGMRRSACSPLGGDLLRGSHSPKLEERRTCGGDCTAGHQST